MDLSKCMTRVSFTTSTFIVVFMRVLSLSLALHSIPLAIPHTPYYRLRLMLNCPYPNALSFILQITLDYMYSSLRIYIPQPPLVTPRVDGTTILVCFACTSLLVLVLIILIRFERRMSVSSRSKRVQRVSPSTVDEEPKCR